MHRFFRFFDPVLRVDIDTGETLALIDQEDGTAGNTQDVIKDNKREHFLESQLIHSRCLEIPRQWTDIKPVPFTSMKGCKDNWIPAPHPVWGHTSPKVSESTVEVTKGTATKDKFF